MSLIDWFSIFARKITTNQSHGSLLGYVISGGTTGTIEGRNGREKTKHKKVSWFLSNPRCPCALSCYYRSVSQYWSHQTFLVFCSLQLVFEAVRESSFRSDMGLDDISFKEYPCCKSLILWLIKSRVMFDTNCPHRLNSRRLRKLLSSHCIALQFLRWVFFPKNPNFLYSLIEELKKDSFIYLYFFNNTSTQLLFFFLLHFTFTTLVTDTLYKRTPLENRLSHPIVNTVTLTSYRML